MFGDFGRQSHSKANLAILVTKVNQEHLCEWFLLTSGSPLTREHVFVDFGRCGAQESVNPCFQSRKWLWSTQNPDRNISAKIQTKKSDSGTELPDFFCILGFEAKFCPLGANFPAPCAQEFWEQLPLFPTFHPFSPGLSPLSGFGCPMFPGLSPLSTPSPP